MEKGETVELNKLPPPLSLNSEEQQPNQVMNTKDEEAAKKLLGVPEAAPRNVLEALQQRKEKYASELAKAEEAKSSSKARRFKRIVNQFEEAIKAHKTGRPYDLEELPIPPGFPPIPVQQSEPVQPVASNVVPLSPIPLPTPKPVVEQKVVKKPVKSNANVDDLILFSVISKGTVSPQKYWQSL